ncbi:HAD-like protein [Mytilinidion resinicola]|uniref:Mitochondrial import inner membrane translocase subunit TIM50 n=1 Tax=Mytilinidion resinicola TaxID=574789 RepID=A0A6A6YPB3_9PEZI|nr:HAD-like protein [Mytilinidion resinicola]KAF2810591.1 HAD-like protein [Mytilinidion resinicola]
MHKGRSRSPTKSPFNRDSKVYTGPAPEPTKKYLEQAALEPHRRFAPIWPQHLLILDLNGTLVHRPDRRNLGKIIPRPYLAPFLEFIFANFDVMVWSSAQPVNVDLMVKKVLGENYTPRLRATWNRNNFGLSKEEYTQNVQVYKQLTRIWNSEELGGCMYSQASTILLDDTVLKAAAEPYNLVEIPEFAATKAQMKSDVLREVAGYLDELRYQMDVSTFIKRHPFKADGTWQMKWSDDLADGGVKLED